MKEFKCKCDSKEFILFQQKETLVDFSREGAVEGHPYLTSLSLHATSIECYSCGAKVTDSVTFQEMLREIV